MPSEPPSAQSQAASSRDDTAQIARHPKPKGGDRDQETHPPPQIALSEAASEQQSSKPTTVREERSTPAPHADSPLPPFKEITPAQRSTPSAAAGKPERAEAPVHKEKLSLALNRPEPLAEPSVKHPVPPPAPPPTVARVAIVIDDFGQDLEMARKFLEIPLPVTFSVLPYQSHSKEIAQLAHDRHREVLLHLPMEPHGYPKTNPGDGALLLSMTQDQMQRTLESALDSSPFASGVNNHMGSRFTEDTRSMKTLLKELQERNLYFLDSYTSPKSTGLAAARNFRMPVGRRDIFLDHEVKEEFTRAQIQRLIRKAKIQGTAIAIGHPHDSTLRVLRESAGKFREAGIAVVPAGQLVTDPSPTGTRK
ncbi:divergent polysaccharide deacetylase family protein [Desulforhabdus sp. TSK]|uniref:divergent polysaccharide deacetylase family protein n=1 Tax=Desulforhabdus sp. TSK TaxID=2925014 RepID=UPI001FC81495|nr:divergent polysaccharide deacetylase family protein [Desulforhabdus sp. TSK]